MGSGVIQPGAAARGREVVADERNSGPGDPGQCNKISLNNSDSFGSIPSNADPGSSDPERGGARGMGKSRKRTRRILIVDDESSIADTLALIFQMQRYETRVAYSAERAIELLGEWRPNLAVLDVILPQMNGIDLALVIKANYPDCHVLLFSGHANTAMLLEEAIRKGHQFEIMAKPVYPDVMLERASELLAKPDEPVFD